MHQYFIDIIYIPITAQFFWNNKVINVFIFSVVCCDLAL